jgi:hypothetical protein
MLCWPKSKAGKTSHTISGKNLFIRTGFNACKSTEKFERTAKFPVRHVVLPVEEFYLHCGNVKD